MNSDCAMGKRGRPLRRLPLLGTLLALCFIALPATFAQPAAAVSFGMQFSTWYRNSDPEDWAAIGRSGAEYFRVPFTPHHEWSEYDRQFELAAVNGVTLLPGITDRIGSEGGIPSSEEKVPYSAWLEEAVNRYGRSGNFWSSHPSIPYHPATDWEVWNEPNNAAISAGEFGSFVGWAGAALQKAAKAKSGMGTGVVMGGILNKSGYLEYLEKAYKAAGSTNVTGVGIHPYSIGQATNSARLSQFEHAIEETRKRLNSAGGSSEVLWITEYGWQVERNENPATENEQAALVRESIDWIRNNASAQNIRAAFWYNYRDTDDLANWDGRCGLRDEVGNFRPSWFAFQEKMGVERWPLATVALQANTNTLWISKRGGGGGNTGLAMKPGTSPSIGLYGRGYKVAFQGSNGNLWYYVSGVGATDTGFGMAPGTSPSITTLQNGMIAFQGSTGTLWYFQTGGPVVNTGFGMAPKTSPSVTWDPRRKRYPIAFQASTGELYIYEPGGFVGSTKFGMAPETSPAITAIDGIGSPNFTIAYQDNVGNLRYYQNGGEVAATPYGLRAKTSPGIASVSGKDRRFVMSFQANTGQMWLYEPGGAVASTGFGMGAETSPSVIGLGDPPYGNPYQIAFNAPTSLYTYEPGGWVTNTLLGPAPATSPSIAPS